MQKDEIWELKPGEGDDRKPEKDEEKPGGETPSEKPGEEGEGKEAGEKLDGKTEETPRKEPGRIDMDEILDLKPDEESPAEEYQEAPPGKKEELELVDIGEKKPVEPAPESEGVVVSRKEEEKITMEKPQVLEPGGGKKEKGPGPELAGGPVKKYERAPVVQESAAPPGKSKLLTVGLFVIFVFLGASAALLALPFFGIEEIPEEMPVVGQIIEFYRGLPLFPE